MKRIILGVFSFLSVSFLAQNQRFSYEYKFVRDSTEKDKSETEIMLLNVFSKGSQFYSKDVFESDSILNAEFKKQSGGFDNHIDLSKFKSKGKVRYQVEKNYPDYSVNFFTNLGSNDYMIQESRKQNWKTLPEKEKIGEFNTQKATCNYAGRTWMAWFTTDIPIQDGPHKFHGLPGLIVKLEDKTKSHIFELKGVTKFDDKEEWKSFKDKERYEPLIVLNDKKYKKIYLDNRADPNKSLRNLLAEGGKFEMKDASGKIMDSNQIMKNREKNQIEANKKNNNLLELDLLK
ncbi:GLPGLI family protein [Chryseobacterium sp. Ch-15]|uniref:GLPGLI family protein n=1 Tax=Chryseobacterium muglaense TaxID=2893752 RepID=A0A9Q3YTS9_9FLAO|nr:GLPGLI family protein [Chryseobacterium muglaense]MBD3903880.1 GLPGLI family protein [Chryseobacterium muglaense]MCC9032935.1 GLPGLI family protein [Chryseobacterium muglaense]MCM2553528.1 GLPGLI family protein [Chryseobacterium muglaense]